MLLVSIIIPTFNRAHLISETLNSVLLQTYTNWECIVVDDGSIDNTREVVNAFVGKDSRIILILRDENRKKGASTCRNIGIENATGNYIQFLDSDDLISPNKLFEQVNLLKNKKNNVIATCKWGRFKHKISDAVIFEKMDSYNSFNNMMRFLDALSNSKGYFPIHVYLIKKSLIDKIGLWNEHLTINDDGEFMMRIITNTDEIVFANDAVTYYRWTDENYNLSNFNNFQRVEDAINSWKLIESYLKIRFKQDSIQYIEKIKEGVYLNVKKNYPELILKHESFFKKQIKGVNFINRGFNKIKRILKKL